MIKTNRRALLGRLPRTHTAQAYVRVSGCGATDVGCRREANEDSFLLLPRNGIWIVADGMGGHAGGQVASMLTVKTVGEALVRRLVQAEREAAGGGQPVNPPQLLDAAIREACALVYDTAQANPALNGMGSTVTMMLVYGAMVYYGHVGDSRAYLVRDGRVHQVTEDHSLVQEQVAAGLITAEQAKVSVMRNIITRSIGFERTVKVDTGAVPVKQGDRFMLCSDGLTGHVEDDEILDLVGGFDHRRSPKRLIDLANSRGGEDNTTVVVFEILGTRGKQHHKRRRG